MRSQRCQAAWAKSLIAKPSATERARGCRGTQGNRTAADCCVLILREPEEGPTKDLQDVLGSQSPYGTAYILSPSSSDFVAEHAELRDAGEETVTLLTFLAKVFILCALMECVGWAERSGLRGGRFGTDLL